MKKKTIPLAIYGDRAHELHVLLRCLGHNAMQFNVKSGEFRNVFLAETIILWSGSIIRNGTSAMVWTLMPGHFQPCSCVDKAQT